MTRLLMIDNYDSFTYNIVQYFGELGADVTVVRNDEATLDEVIALVEREKIDRLVISPGPCSPAEADRKSTRLNSSHLVISYAVFCLKKKTTMCTDRELGFPA